MFSNPNKSTPQKCCAVPIHLLGETGTNGGAIDTASCRFSDHSGRWKRDVPQGRIVNVLGAKIEATLKKPLAAKFNLRLFAATSTLSTTHLNPSILTRRPLR